MVEVGYTVTVFHNDAQIIRLGFHRKPGLIKNLNPQKVVTLELDGRIRFERSRPLTNGRDLSS